LEAAHGRPRRLRLEGARWAGVTILEVTPSGLLLETPSEPELAIGTRRRIEVDGRTGETIVDVRYPHPEPGKSFYAVRIIEHDAGLLDALARGVSGRRGRARISGRDAVD
jgi:hypothetical protein